MPIPKSTNYALVHNGTVVAVGNKKDMAREMKRKGGCKAGYCVYFTVQTKQVGNKI